MEEFNQKLGKKTQNNDNVSTLANPDIDRENDLEPEPPDENTNVEENLIVEIPISYTPVNENQIIINAVLHSTAKPKVTI